MTVVMKTSSARRSLARLPRVVWSKGSSPRQSSPRHRATRRSRRAERDRGAVLVEFALILPIFIALVFGIISYGYMLSYRQSLGQAASESARAAAVVPSGMSPADKTTRALAALNESLVSYGMTCSAGVLKHGTTTSGSCDVQTKTPCPSDATRSCAIVTVTHNYRDHPLIPSFPGLGPTLPSQLTYKAVVEVN